MSNSSRALVPVERKLPSLRRKKRKKGDAFALVEKDVFLRDRAMVRRYLPDILGKVVSPVDFLFLGGPAGGSAPGKVFRPRK